MLNLEAVSEIRTIAEFLDTCGFHYASSRLVPADDRVVFPEFGELQRGLASASPFHRFLFSVFRQGHVAVEGAVRAFLPASVFDACLATGLLVRDAWGEYRTPDLAIASVHGLKLVVSLPPNYPTAASRKQPVYLGFDSLMLATSLPGTLRGRRVLDICTGSGIQGLLCAARGASRVVALELSPIAANVARFNALLNGLQDTVDVRESNLYQALAADERFDFVVSNPPFMPMVEGFDFPIAGTGGLDGTEILRPLLDGINAHVSDNFSGAIVCNAVGDQYNIFIDQELHKIAERDGYHVNAVVSDKLSLLDYANGFMEPQLRSCCIDVPGQRRRDAIDDWLGRMNELGVERVYLQILRFSRPDTRAAGLSYIPTYDARGTDPLVSLVRRHRGLG